MTGLGVSCHGCCVLSHSHEKLKGPLFCICYSEVILNLPIPQHSQYEDHALLGLTNTDCLSSKPGGVI